jgi:transcriptional regulator with XRE-family HTH domain
MNKRLETFLKAEQLSPARFAEIMDIQRSGVSHLLSGRNKPGFDFFEKFLRKFPVVNIEWLISGRGGMYKESIIKPIFPEYTSNSDLKKSPNKYDNLSEENPKSLPEKKDMPQVLPAEQCKNQENKQIDKMIILYTDGTFSDYVKNKNL